MMGSGTGETGAETGARRPPHLLAEDVLKGERRRAVADGRVLLVHKGADEHEGVGVGGEVSELT